MDNQNNITNLPAVSIGDTSIERIIYKGEPVLTFAQIDKAHNRADSTARQAFNRNKKRFEIGEDFVVVKATDFWPYVKHTAKGGNRGDVTLITRRGYLKLTKPMNDDVSWKVQGEMVDRYFVVEQIKNNPISFANTISKEARLTLKDNIAFAKLLGLKGNQLALAANKATKAMTGCDVMGLMEITHLKAPKNEALLTPSDIGERLGVSSQAVNLMLSHIGAHQKFRDAKGKPYYEPTSYGEEIGGEMMDTGKKHSNGTPIRQLKWSSSVIDALQELSA